MLVLICIRRWSEIKLLAKYRTNRSYYLKKRGIGEPGIREPGINYRDYKELTYLCPVDLGIYYPKGVLSQLS